MIIYFFAIESFTDGSIIYLGYEANDETTGGVINEVIKYECRKAYNFS